jgi:hypothetical protein
MSYSVIEINKWSKFVDYVSDPGLPYRKWAFRGQADSQWPLSSSLYRYLSVHLPISGDWERREEHSLRAFMRRAQLLLERVPAEDQIFEWWGLMQHHGAPTRLLDFTFSPYVAAFFALEKATNTAAVWALNPSAMKNITSTKHIPIESGKDTTFFYGEPFILSKRLVAQQGTFVITRTLDKPIDKIIEHLDNPTEVLVKFLLPVEKIRSEGMKSLYRMNITQATLFPGLDGLARSMAYELEFRWFE